MMRRLFNLLTAVSLALCVATVVLWVRSYWRHDSVQTRARASYEGMTLITRFVTVSSSHGGVKCSIYRYTESFITPLLRGGGPLLQWHSQPNPSPFVRRSPSFWNRIYFDVYEQTSTPGSQREQIMGVIVPHWLILVASAVLPAMAVWRVRERRFRSMEGRCQICGYDLRATPQRCPECGTLAARELGISRRATEDTRQVV